MKLPVIRVPRLIPLATRVAPGETLDDAPSHERVQTLYDRFGPIYAYLRWIEDGPTCAAVRALAPRRGERALDVGCGSGAGLLSLASLLGSDHAGADGPPPVCGVDLSARMLSMARRRLQDADLSARVEVRQADACALPYPDQSFDITFCGYLFDHLSAADIALALKEMRRVLRPGGRLAILAMAPGSDAAGQTFTRLHARLYRASPALVAGRRPIDLEPHVLAAGFSVLGSRDWLRVYPSRLVVCARPL